MALSDLEVFSEYAYTTMTEILDYKVNLFNAATQGGLTLTNAAMQGDYSTTAHWAKINGLVRRRNAYGSGTVAAKDLAMLTRTSVKVAAGTPPVNIDPGMLKWIQKSPEEAGAVIGRQLAPDTMADMLSVAVNAYLAALGQVTALVHDGTASTPDLRMLNQGAAKFGDRAQDIMCWLMHSKNQFDIYDVALQNSAGLFQFGNVRVVQDGFGRPLVVSDVPALVETDGVGAGTDKYNILGLTNGAVIVEQGNEYTSNVETKNGDENILRTWQAEWVYQVGVKGFEWDKASGGPSPTDAALSTATNWDRYATYDKDLAGVIIETQ